MKAAPVLALLLSLGASLQAQSPATAIQQAERFQQRQEATRPRFRETIPTLYEGEEADVGPQYVVMPKVKQKWIELSLDSQFFYTSNVFLTEQGNVDSTLSVHTLVAGLAPTPWDVPGGKLAVRAGYRHQFFRYGDLTSHPQEINNLNFDVATVYTQLRYQFHENWIATIGFDYNRLLSGDDGRHEFYVEALPYWGLERQIQFNENSLLSIGYTGNYHATRVDKPGADINDRSDEILSLVYSHKLGEKLVIQPYYRLQFTHYNNAITPDRERNEWLNSIGLSATWFFTEWASIRAFINYDVRDSSDEAVQDYHKLDTGGGISITLAF